jgi:ADP-heptose:LPS heptosyltransferase
VLAIRLHALGDTVLTLPYLNALRHRLPGTSLDFLTREEVADVPRSVDLFDRVFAIGGGRDPRRIWLSAAALIPRLRARRYGVVLDLQANRLSGVVRRLCAPAAWSEFDRFSPRLAGERTRATIEAAGIGPLQVWADLDLRRPELGLDALRAAGWSLGDPIVVLNPAGLTPGRCWPLSSWLDFAERWAAGARGGTQFAVLGLPRLRPAVVALRRRLGDRVLDLVARTSPGEAFAVVRRASLVVSEDSGLMHMAWVAGAPTLGLFGASRAEWARPHGSRSACVQACRLRDGDCLSGACRSSPPSCLERLDPAEVVRRARALLDRLGDGPGALYVAGVAHAPPLEERG